MFKLLMHQDAEDDIEDLWSSDPHAAAAITVFVQELSRDQDALDRLTQHNYGVNWKREPFNVSWIIEQRDAGRNLWRLKLWSLEHTGHKYRLIYAFLPKKHHYYLLGVFPRSDYNYEQSDPRTERVISAYQQLCD